MQKPKSKLVEGNPTGSALVMVVVLTVLLAAIGVLFVMASRIDEMSTSSIVKTHDLDLAVESVVELISESLTQDVTLAQQEAFDFPGWDNIRGDRWLSTINPDPNDPDTPADYSDDFYIWTKLTDLTGELQDWGKYSLLADIYLPVEANDIPHVPNWYTLPWYARDYQVAADADGDGVTDSIWIRLPGKTGARGEPIFAAVRIIDNCGMLNLNTAHSINSNSEGRYLSQVDYRRFLKGSDLGPIYYNNNNDYNLSDWNSIRLARQGGVRLPLDPDNEYHYNAIMNIENPLVNMRYPDFRYSLFDISDELEIRNRYILTSPYEARFERPDIANFTFDADGGIYSALSIPVQRGTARNFPNGGPPYSHFDAWKWRLDPNNFDNNYAYYDGLNPHQIDYRWKYDRRHICTFYSFDRNLRLGAYPQVTVYDQNGNFDYKILMPFKPDPSAVGTDIGQWTWDSSKLQYYYNYNNTLTRLQILKLLYAFRAYFLVKDHTPNIDPFTGEDIYTMDELKSAAKKSAQFVANMIDYADDDDVTTQGPFFDPLYGSQTNDNLTYINRDIIRQLIIDATVHLHQNDPTKIIDIGPDPQSNPDPRYEFGLGLDSADPDQTIYGYEKQPFIAEIATYNNSGDLYYAIELVNPYEDTIYLEGWQIKIGSYEYIIQGGDAIASGGPVRVPAATVGGSRQLGRLLLVDDANISGNPFEFTLPGLKGFGGIASGYIVQLQRPNPNPAKPDEFITVDKTIKEQTDNINMPGPGNGEYRVSKRDDKAWKFTNRDSYTTNDTSGTLGSANNVTLDPKGWQMPVADDNQPIGTLLDFERVLLIGNEDPNDTAGKKAITEKVSEAWTSKPGDESEIRNNIRLKKPNPLSLFKLTPLDYVCVMSRPEGNLPGRININTATMEVIRAAIPPNNSWDPKPEQIAKSIVARRNDQPLIGNPFTRITDLLVLDGFKQFSDPNNLTGVGDPDMRGDFEERDWLLSKVANTMTVRSDTFTAYILVRLGHNGPEKRMIAIFDRSKTNPWDKITKKPRIVALHPVPDPR